MKKIKYLLMLCIFTIISTGCVKYNANMEIKKDKSMDFTIVYALDKTMFGEDNALKEDQFEEVKKAGFEITKYSEGNYEGFKMTKKIANIDDVSTESDVEYNLSGMMSESNDNKYIFKVVKGTDKNTYTAKFKFDSNDSGLNDNNMTNDEEDTNTDTKLPDQDMFTEDYPDEEDTLTTDSSNSLDNMDLSGLTSSMDLSFNVTLPNAAISSNATTKEDDNKKLSWKLTTSGKQDIEFSFELDNDAAKSSENSNLILYIGIGVGVLLILVLVIVLLSKKKKTVGPVQETVAEPVTEHKEENTNNE